MAFKCSMCGLCCTKSSVSILPHENVILKKLADKYGLPYSSTPGYVVYDSLNKRYIALSYVMHLSNGKCLFLEGNKCKIHYEYKPLICRSFPYVPKRVRYVIVDQTKSIYAKVDYGISLECLFVKNNKRHLEELLVDEKYIYDFFEEQIREAVKMESLRNTILNLLSNLWHLGLISISEKTGEPFIVQNVYDVLRTQYPELPYILGINKVFEMILAK